MARLDPEDDFVFTLSDEEAPNVDSDAEFAGNNKGTVSGIKRRREEPENAQVKQSANSKKRKKHKKGGKHDTNVNKTSKAISDGAEEEEDEYGEDENGVLNPDFEFDVGGVANGGLVEDFDGWGDEGRNKSKTTEKKGVDIDDILDRRRQKKLEKEERERKKAEKRAVEGDEDMEDDEAEAGEGNDMQVDLDDDELLAPDVFGMGAQGTSESEEEGEEAESDGDEEENKGRDGEGDEDDDDDTNSVASAVPHPDDLASEEDGSGSESEDYEEIRKQNEFFAPEEQVTESKPTSGAPASFQNLFLSRPILRGLASVGFSAPTPIQRKTIPVALLGKDVVGGAVTGSGKTAAFIVPILERLLYRPRKVPTSRVAILMPTRELAVQCYNVATKLATFTDITFCQLVGGFSLREQENILKKRPDVIIATPGRFIDHMRNSASFTVDTLEILVLDEADRMLEDGFAEELNEILTTIPKSRQTMLFSATMTNSVDKLIRVGLNKPVRLMVDSKKQTVGTLVQEFVRLRPGREDKRLGYLMFLCKTVYTNRVIVFFRQKKEAHRARIIFGLMGLKAAELHGSMSQEQVSRPAICPQ